MTNYRNGLAIATMAVWLAAPMAAQRPDAAQAALKAAIDKEMVDGDLKGAIALYEKAVAEAKADRATAAKALIRMADCHQKLGNSESRKIYERVVREYADQKEAAATARARLGSVEAKGAGAVARQVWTGPRADTFGTVSPDGRYLSFTDWDTGDLAVHDLTTGADRRITNRGSWSDSDESAEESAISPDGRLVAYAWNTKDDKYDLRIANLSGDPSPRRLYYNDDIFYTAPLDWTPDGKWIAVKVVRKDRTAQIGLVSSTDGSLRVLKSIDWRGATKMFVSPDGKFLAYDLPAAEPNEKRDIFVLAIDGSREIPAVAHPADDAVIGWTPDGKHLLFTSDRTSSTDLWALAFSEARVQGAPALVKANIGQLHRLNLSRSGAMYFGIQAESPDIYVASVNFATGEVIAPPTKPVDTFIGSNSWPAWSPDGKYFSYISRRQTAPRAPVVLLLLLKTVETGRTREFRLGLDSIFGPHRWTQDGRSIAVQGRDPKGRQGVYRVDVETGAVAPIVLSSQPDENIGLIGWSTDAGKLYFRRQNAGRSVFIERTLASGSERERAGTGLERGTVSPDGRLIASVQIDESSRASVLMVVPVQGGESKELVRAKPGELSWQTTEWTSDGRSLVFRKGRELWTVSLADGASRKINADLGTERSLRLHPDGQQIAWSAGRSLKEIWVLDNFLPVLSAKK